MVVHFEVSKRLITNDTPDTVMDFAQRQFSKVSSKTRLDNGQLKVRMVEASFGSINRSDITCVQLQRISGGLPRRFRDKLPPLRMVLVVSDTSTFFVHRLADPNCLLSLSARNSEERHSVVY